MHNTALPPPRRAGLIESTVLKLFTRPADVLDVEELGHAFRLVTLGGDALRDVDWTPGDKIQIQLGGWMQRTYTPIEWDADTGRTRILVYLHGDTPGTRWARGLRKGDSCAVFGPRGSVRLERPASLVILFGDETSLGLARALANHACAPTVVSVLEVRAAADMAAAVDHLQLHYPHRSVRLDGDAHFPELEARMTTLLRAHPEAAVVLTGKAGSIQRMGRLLRQLDVSAGRRQSKAYWAPGKTGMD
nr:siderophore-interacting protein [uncultured Duganella sp.]